MTDHRFQEHNALHKTKPVINNLGVPTRDVQLLHSLKLIHETPSIFKNNLKRDPLYKDHDLHARIVKNAKTGWHYTNETLKFAATTAIIFGLLFVSANYSAYYKRFIYWKDSIQPVSAVDPEVALLEGLVNDKPADDITQVMLTSDQVKSVEETLNKAEVIDFDAIVVNPNDFRLVIPKLKINAPVISPDPGYLLRGDWDGLEKAIQDDLHDGLVRYPGTGVPQRIGNVFITGHSSYYFWDSGRYKDVFATLDQLFVGDEITVYYEGKKTVYRVSDIKVVKPQETQVLNQPDDKSILTLMTCTPVGTNTNRLIIVADQVYPNPANNKEAPPKESPVQIKADLHA